MSIKEYSDKHRSLFSKFATHVCKICHKTIRWDSDTIVAHLEKVHSTTPADYVRDHLKDEYDVIMETLSKAKRNLTPTTGVVESSGSDLANSWTNQVSML
jgi:hypothetical protein